MRELDFLAWIRSQSEFDPAAVPVGPGDDCAIVACGDQSVIVTTDQVLDGVHFVLAEHGPEAAGYKAMARGLSDIAAMAARPIAAVATVAMPPGMRREQAEGIYHGLRAAAAPFECPIVGGDVGSWPSPLAITTTVLGRPAGATGRIKPVLRNGARAGNALCVTGALGGAWRTDRHLRFSPRIAEAIALALRCKLRAMIDLSDGLATDLAHVCEASGVGAEIDAAAVPIHPDAVEHTAGPDEALRAALTDGEDYELLFTLPARQAEAISAKDWLPVKVTRIGTITRQPGLVLLHPDGRREPFEARGWEHKT